MSAHAFQRALARNISLKEMQEAGENVVIIEDYPNDKYSPSCLILGFTSTSRPLHIQVSRRLGTLKVITLYQPNSDEWSDNYSRRNL
nr:DUF4258 domain-containing protein [Ancylothrix sp. D3o]